MNEVDLYARDDPKVICNKCKTIIRPYPDAHAPEIDEVACPQCGEKRLLYFGTDPSVVKLILSNLGINKELTERVTDLENKLSLIKLNLDKSLVEAKNVMTTALINSVNHEIEEHERKWHPTSQNQR